MKLGMGNVVHFSWADPGFSSGGGGGAQKNKHKVQSPFTAGV